MAGANKERVVLVDPETLETFKVYVNPEDVSRIETNPSYQQKMINDIKKVKNQNNLVELKLRDAKRDKALADLQYANDLLHEHLSVLGSLSNVGQKTSTLKQGVNAESGAVFELTLVDSLTMDSYTLFVDQVTINRVQTELLEKHKAAINQQKSHTLSTSIEKNNDPANIINEVHSHDELEQLIERYENDDIGDDPSPIQTGRYSWTDAATLLLINLYQENDAAYSEWKLTNKKFWKKITDGMLSKGYDVSYSQCTSKIDNLKRSYKNVKDHNAQSGNDKKTCIFYEELDELFSKKPWIKPLSVAGSNMPLGDLDINSSTSNLKRPRSLLEVLKASYLQQTIEIKRLKREYTENYREKKLAVMKDLVHILKK
ncbi:uncharacterized protein LOC107981810 isoform X2 [Nasonia vitripennis]|uniref:Myb/SANT-like DNA-binding domain-containing protein n=1 Tax=Nasonia vitripennis TaxID=7425 RepID=A0A7M7Q0A3_NASVI|nr:uncharacterized protein LOC107981810 isoform X2 [Nasonia vitripennis]